MKARQRLSDEAIARRLPVWCALTDFFLDTEMTDDAFQRIAEIVQDAGYSAEEGEDILLHEVAPVFGSNLLAVAGEWAPWPHSFVEAKMRAWAAGSRTGGRLTARLLHRTMQQEWARLLPYWNDAQPKPR